jgi:hypothetical protein
MDLCKSFIRDFLFLVWYLASKFRVLFTALLDPITSSNIDILGYFAKFNSFNNVEIMVFLIFYQNSRTVAALIPCTTILCPVAP